MKKKVTIFEGPYDKMCDALRLGYENYEASQADFQKINVLYTKQYGQMAIAAVLEARKMPGLMPRISVQTSVKDQLQAEANFALISWLSIMGFIERAWPKEAWKSMKNNAGKTLYPAAASGDWGALCTMLQDGSSFLTTYDLSKGGMPPTFPDEYSAAQERYNALYDAYTGSKQQVSVKTGDKIDALNNVYAAFSALSRDAKRLYRGNPEKQKLFAYNSLLQKVTGIGRGGFHISLRKEGTLLPVTSSTLFMNPGNYKFAADEKGIIIAAVKAGTYSFVLTTPGSETVEGTLKATAGVMHREEFIIHPAKAAVA